MNAPAKSKSLWRRAINGATVFVLAFVVRLAYLFLLAPRQLCGLNDKANFDCAAALITAQHLATSQTPFAMTSLGQYVGSLQLPDVLLKNGPVYPFYLAAQAKFFGLKPTADPTQFNCMPFVVTNIVVDALACVLIYYTARLAFNKRAAAIAATLAIIYPAAIANTMHCYSEPLCYFLVSAWLCLICSVLLRHGKSFWTWLSYLGIGTLSALVVFCLPTLLLLPVLTGGLLFAYKFGEPLKQMFGGLSNHLERMTATTAPPAVPAPSGGAGVPPAFDRKVAEQAGETRSGEESVSTPAIQEIVLEAGVPPAPPSEAETGEQSVSTAAGDETAVEAGGTPARPGKTSYRSALALILMLVGAVAVAAPWFWLQNATRHRFDLVSEPILAARIWLGNLSTSEGWRLLPANEFPVSSISVVLHSIFTSMLSIPVPYFTLLMQKVARIFAASWNDYQLTVFGISPLVQNIFHALVLFTAYIGFSFATLQYPRWRLSRLMPCAVALSSVVVYHLVYCVFHCSSRNAFTAMPAIFVLSGFCLDRIAGHIREVRTQFGIMLVVAAMLFGWLLSGMNLVPLFSAMISSDVNARFADMIVVGAAWLFLLSLALSFARLESRQKVSSASDMLKFGCFCAIAIMIGCGFDERWREWKTELKNEHEIVEQTIVLPALTEMPDLTNRLKANPVIFVLVDVQSPFLAPPLAVTVNNVAEVGPAFPWLQLKPFDRDSLQDIDTQARGMGVDWRSFRQWWAVPVPFSALKFGAHNNISVSLLPSDGVAGHKIFGQYGSATTRRNDSYMMLPSPYTISWEKGFATFAAGDMRLPESIVLQGKVVSSSLESIGVEGTSDLSFDHGVQTGSYRIRLALPLSNQFTVLPGFTSESESPSKPPPVAQLSDEIRPFEHDEATGISAKDESSQMLTAEPVAIGQALPAGAIFVFQSEFKSLTGDQSASTIKIEFSGKDSFGQEIKWVSPWQPDCISISKDWQLFTFADFIPENIQSLKDPHVSIQVIPYDNARRILRPNAALSQEIAVRKVSLAIMPPLAIPLERDRDWMIF